MKSILINIQVDGVGAADLADIEKGIDEALKQYKRKRVSYNLTDMMGPQLPPQED